jgi:signal transduction histidine kinase
MSKNPNGDVTIQHLQAIVERDKSALAREMHDEMGGYLIASAMDVTLLRHRFAAHDADTQGKFDRLSQLLNDAIDMMRRVTEELHPTLLDNVGLFAALRWQIKHMCHRANITFRAHFPEVEPLLGHAAAIMLFRVGEEALIVAENHPAVQKVDFTIQTDNERLLMQVVADGTKGPLPGANGGDDALGFLRHRIMAMGGDVSLGYPNTGGISLTARVLLADALAFH